MDGNRSMFPICLDIKFTNLSNKLLVFLHANLEFLIYIYTHTFWTFFLNQTTKAILFFLLVKLRSITYCSLNFSYQLYRRLYYENLIIIFISSEKFETTRILYNFLFVYFFIHFLLPRAYIHNKQNHYIYSHLGLFY